MPSATPTQTEPSRGLLDTNILILQAAIDPDELPDEMAISSITLGELTAGVQLITPVDSGSRMEFARRLDVLQRAEDAFDPIPYDVEAARAYGRIAGAVAASGRSVRARVADLQIAAIAAAHGLPVYTTNPNNFAGLEGIVEVVAVKRPILRVSRADREAAWARLVASADEGIGPGSVAELKQDLDGHLFRP